MSEDAPFCIYCHECHPLEEFMETAADYQNEEILGICWKHYVGNPTQGVRNHNILKSSVSK